MGVLRPILGQQQPAAQSRVDLMQCIAGRRLLRHGRLRLDVADDQVADGRALVSRGSQSGDRQCPRLTRHLGHDLAEGGARAQAVEQAEAALATDAVALHAATIGHHGHHGQDGGFGEIERVDVVIDTLNGLAQSQGYLGQPGFQAGEVLRRQGGQKAVGHPRLGIGHRFGRALSKARRGPVLHSS